MTSPRCPRLAAVFRTLFCNYPNILIVNPSTAFTSCSACCAMTQPSPYAFACRWTCSAKFG